MRTCSVLLEPELAHVRREEGLELTLEGFEDLHVSLLGDCHCCARFFDEDWSDDASGRDCSPHCAFRRVQGIGRVQEDWWLALSPCTLSVPCTLLNAQCGLALFPSKFSHLKPVPRLAERELWRPSDRSQD